MNYKCPLISSFTVLSPKCDVLLESISSLHIKSKDDESPIHGASTAAHLIARSDNKENFSVSTEIKKSIEDYNHNANVLSSSPGSNRWRTPDNIFSPQMIRNATKKPISIIKLISPPPDDFASTPTELIKPTPSATVASFETVKARLTMRGDPFNAVSSSSLVSRSSEDDGNSNNDASSGGKRDDDETTPTIGTRTASAMHVSPDEISVNFLQAATAASDSYKDSKKIDSEFSNIRRTLSNDEFMARNFK